MAIQIRYCDNSSAYDPDPDNPFVFNDGTCAWYGAGKLHRTNGPAVSHPDGYEEWWFNGKRHRVDGPAVTWANGHQEWFIEGIRVPDQLSGWLLYAQMQSDATNR